MSVKHYTNWQNIGGHLFLSSDGEDDLLQLAWDRTDDVYPIKFEEQDLGTITYFNPVFNADVEGQEIYLNVPITSENVTLATSIINITWAALKELKDNEELIPGQQYRITDYITTTVQPDTNSTEHQFDIIVTADDGGTLNENARAAKHAGDDYFADCDLATWEIKYSLDNDKKYIWAKSKGFTNSSEEDYWYRDKLLDNSGPSEYPIAWSSLTATNRTVFTETEDIEEGTPVYGGYPAAILFYIQSIQDEGKGVIFYMKDEWNNECPYDFKNIQFKRPLSNGEYDPDGQDTWVYTFTWVDEDLIINDVSVIGKTLTNDEYECNGCHSNSIKECIDYYYPYSLLGPNLRFSLSNNCCISSSNLDSHIYGGNINIKIGINSYSNTLKHCCKNIIFGESCYNNIIGAFCNSIVFGDYNNTNECGDTCTNNIFGMQCYSNSLGAECNDNTFGNRFNNNTLTGNSSRNIFGNYCSYNEVVSSSDNTLGNYCEHNILCKSSSSNGFGNNCSYINFDGGKSGNYAHNIFENGVKFIKLTPSSGTGALQNIKVCQGVCGTSSEYKTITEVRGLTHQVTYRPTGSEDKNI